MINVKGQIRETQGDHFLNRNAVARTENDVTEFETAQRHKRVGVFGGTFDPIHIGHLILAEACLESCKLDEVWFLPAARPPHKLDADITDGGLRRQMLELATAGEPAFQVKSFELDRQGTSYTVDTLAELVASHTGTEFYFLIGADSLVDLRSWREPLRILELANVVAVNRGDQPEPDLDRITEQLGDIARRRIQLVHMPAVELSANEIRQRVLVGKRIRFLVPRAVEAFILEHGLYCSEDPPKQ